MADARMSDDPEVMRNRAENAARLAASAFPPAIELKLKKFWYWNGDPPAPEITHWTGRGVFSIRAQTPLKTVSVFLDNMHLGFVDYNPAMAAQLLAKGSFDRELGFAATDLVPPTLAGWNDLGC